MTCTSVVQVLVVGCRWSCLIFEEGSIGIVLFDNIVPEVRRGYSRGIVLLVLVVVNVHGIRLCSSPFCSPILKEGGSPLRSEDHESDRHP